MLSVGVSLIVFVTGEVILAGAYNSYKYNTFKLSQHASILHCCFMQLSSNLFSCLSFFRCDCTLGYRGKNCSELDFCVVGTCPDGSTCQSLQDGFECKSESCCYLHQQMTKYWCPPVMALNLSPSVETV